MLRRANRRLGGTLAVTGVAALCCVLGCRPAAFDELTNGAGGPLDGAVELDAAAPDAASSQLDAQLVDDAAVPLDATTSADDATAGDAALAEAGALDTGAVDADAVDAGPQTLVLSILKDEDDGFWYRPQGTDLAEKLHFEPMAGEFDDHSFEVGTDYEQCRTMLRFLVPIAPGATVLSARLRLKRVGAARTAPATATMRVHVFESANLAALDAAHSHAVPAEHAAEGLWSQSVEGFQVGTVGGFTESPELAVQLQHVLDRPDWQQGGYIGFLLSPDLMADGQFANFLDSSAALALATLTVSYLP